VDRFAAKYPSMSDYSFVANSPLIVIDPEGDTIRIISVWNGWLDPGHTAIALVGKNVKSADSRTLDGGIDGGARSGVRFWNPGGVTTYGGGKEEIPVTRHFGTDSYEVTEIRNISRYADYEATMKQYLKNGENIAVVEWVLPDEVEKQVDLIIGGKRTNDYEIFGCASSCREVLYDAFDAAGYSEAKAKEYSELIVNSTKPFLQDRDEDSLIKKGASRKKTLGLNKSDEVIHTENEVLSETPAEFKKE
jgi:hypothetical protein